MIASSSLQEAQQPGRTDAYWPLLFGRSLFLPEDLGGNRYPYEVVRRLGDRGHPVTVLTARLSRPLPALKNISYRTYPVSRRHPFLTHLTNVGSASAAIRLTSLPPQKVALVGSYDVALALTACAPQLPMVFLFHSEFYSEWVQALGTGLRAVGQRAIRSYMQAVERQVFRHSARIIAVSQFSARQIEERVPSASARVRAVSTGVDTGYFMPPADRGSALRAIGHDEKDILILGTGRLVAVKQFDRLIRAFAALSNRFVRARLIIAGGGPEAPRLERLIEDLGMTERVHLAGFCDPPRLRALMQAADLQVCSSAFENFSLAILEAFSCGTPVLGTPGGGTPELLGALDPALVLSDDSVHALSEGLERFLVDRSRLETLGRQARDLAVRRFDWDRVVDQLEDVCEEILRPATRSAL